MSISAKSQLLHSFIYINPALSVSEKCRKISFKIQNLGLFAPIKTDLISYSYCRLIRHDGQDSEEREPFTRLSQVIEPLLEFHCVQGIPRKCQLGNLPSKQTYNQSSKVKKLLVLICMPCNKVLINKSSSRSELQDTLSS